MNMPLTSEGALWPFARQKKKVSDAEKLELLMLKEHLCSGYLHFRNDDRTS
jgi:hypothetical protein